ncbi:MAG: FHA domain-containing protein [Planctomycetales bacterium]|nr:FHA domain-containing protein [Planctomycetales bacterium]
MQLKLKVLRGASAGREIAVKGPQFFIGRSEECHLRANSDAISRKHCGILIKDSEALVRDLGSRNGTYVNGNKLEKPHVLAMGDHLRVGPLEFLVTISEPAKSKATVEKPAEGDDLAGMISDWLDEQGDSPTAESSEPKTREYKAGETAKIRVDAEATPPETSSEPKRLPKTTNKNAPKDTQEAAAQTLKKFFNRGSS